MVFDRRPDIARRIVRGLEGHHPAPSIEAVLDCATSLTRDGFCPPPWEDLMQQEPEPSRDNAEPGRERDGRRGQRNLLIHVSSDTLCAGGPMASLTIPSRKEFRLEPQSFRLLFLRPAPTTVQRAGQRGGACGDVCREGGGRVRVNVFVRGTWTFTISTGWTGGGWKWWCTGCRSGMAHSWPSTPQWFRQ